MTTLLQSGLARSWRWPAAEFSGSVLKRIEVFGKKPSRFGADVVSDILVLVLNSLDSSWFCVGCASCFMIIRSPAGNMQLPRFNVEDSLQLAAKRESMSVPEDVGGFPSRKSSS